MRNYPTITADIKDRHTRKQNQDVYESGQWSNPAGESFVSYFSLAVCDSWRPCTVLQRKFDRVKLHMGPLFHDYICVYDAGNMVEWCLPHDINLDGVEFKSMASGSHRITSDFMCVTPLTPTIQVNFTL